MMSSESLISILRQHSGKEEISESHSIVSDLGIDGDDADELYLDLLDNYGIDLKKLEHIEQCFHSEGELLDSFYMFKWVFHKLGLRQTPPIRPLAPLYVSDLLDFVRSNTNA